MTLRLLDIRDAMEGACPAVLSTCSPQGVPNIAYLSQVHYVDEQNLALSYQFFNSTRRNILANPHAQLVVPDPFSAQMYRMRLRYLRTERDGPLYERMKAHLEGIASHTGMAGVFRLLGSDIYEVRDLHVMPGPSLPRRPLAPNPLSALRRISDTVAQCADLAALIDATLDGVVRELGIEHAMFLMYDEAAERLYTVASRGYPASGVGSEIALGDGLIGVCARARTPIRISWMTQAYRYSRTIRDLTLRDGAGNTLSAEIPYPGLADPHSQLGVPLLHAGRVYGVLFVESEQDLRFTYDHEDGLVLLAAQLAASVHALRDAGDALADAETPAAPPATLPSMAAAQGTPEPSLLRVRCYGGNHSIFFGDSYIIKGVAGAVLWRLLCEYRDNGRTEFTNREIRLDPGIRLPDIVDNLEARLILLRRRLAEQQMGVGLEKCGRGRLRLTVNRPLQLQAIDAQ